MGQGFGKRGWRAAAELLLASVFDSAGAAGSTDMALGPVASTVDITFTEIAGDGFAVAGIFGQRWNHAPAGR
jgi:hypothetical protein